MLTLEELDAMWSMSPTSLSHHVALRLAAADAEDRGTVAELSQLAEDLREAHAGPGAFQPQQL